MKGTSNGRNAEVVVHRRAEHDRHPSTSPAHPHVRPPHPAVPQPGPSRGGQRASVIVSPKWSRRPCQNSTASASYLPPSAWSRQVSAGSPSSLKNRTKYMGVPSGRSLVSILTEPISLTRRWASKVASSVLRVAITDPSARVFLETPSTSATDSRMAPGPWTMNRMGPRKAMSARSLSSGDTLSSASGAEARVGWELVGRRKADGLGLSLAEGEVQHRAPSTAAASIVSRAGRGADGGGAGRL
mmetsp:Transcript_21837/g.73491  ORF Transcript_21837/g.73491 Transcript_21837/m.73491 type:complete len:243 (+) Transcript_21837:263-991(+)